MDDTGNKTRRNRLIFINIIIACFATTMMSTALSTALPAIITDINISASTGQWLTSGYTLAMAIMVPLTSFMVKRVPTRKLFFGVVGIFLLGLIIDIIATDFYTLLLGRIFQAGANGILIAAAQIILLTIYPLNVHGKIMGWYGITLTAAPIIAPVIAGFLIDGFGWRAVFMLPAAILVVSLIVTLFTFENILETSKLKFDTLSFIICAFAFGGLTFGVGNVMTYGVTDMMFIVPILVGIVAFILFIKRQLSLEKPFLQMRLFKSKQFTLSMVNCMLFYVIVMATSILAPMCYQMALGYTATESGLILMPGTILVAILSPFAGVLYDKYGIKVMAIGFSLLMFVANIMMFFIDADTATWYLVLSGIIRGIGGALMMPLTTWCMGSVEDKYRADATSLNNSLRTLAGAAGMAILVGVMDSTASTSSYIEGSAYAFMIAALISIVMIVLAFFAKTNTRERID